MSKNIKEIGKELLGKSLNSFHRKTGLTQLEKNNEMQDGILDGILSQVDDAYIEKTEQSNVIHLDGSGDGVIVLDSIEGNTMVNLLGRPTKTNNANVIINNNKTISWIKTEPTTGAYSVTFRDSLAQVDKIYTLVFNILENTMVVEGKDTIGKFNIVSYNSGNYFIPSNKTGLIKILLKQPSTSTGKAYLEVFKDAIGTLTIENPYILEGDWTNRELPTTLEGIQSSFEEKVNDEGKYEIEILMKNKNLLDLKNPVNVGYTPAKMEGDKIVLNSSGVEGERVSMAFPVYMKKGSTYRFSYSNIEGNSEVLGPTVQMHTNLNPNDQFGISTKNPFTWDKESRIYYARIYNMYVAGTVKANVQLEENNIATTYIKPKQNKIKLLLNNPLLKGDKLIVKDGKLYHYHKRKVRTLKGDNSEPWQTYNCLSGSEINTKGFTISYDDILPCGDTSNLWTHICDKLPTAPQQTIWSIDKEGISTTSSSTFRVRISRDKATTIQELRKYLSTNPITVCYELLEPYYEEVLNEYGEPIILEGYENGTLYIDSTVIPTTTVRYTPKMESFKTLKEVNKNNNLITLDINENIIPYMMDVDYMIMEKELCLLNTKNIRKMEELDMTSMQKRTQDMLERLIKGKTLTEQECKTRVTTYLNAGKITDEQAEELMLVISEVYA